nr:MAG TPA: hypothetical protein [Caudoviricetes sp.]
MLINLLKTINRHNQRVPTGTLYFTQIFIFYKNPFYRFYKYI